MISDLLALFGISRKKKDAGTQAQSAKEAQAKQASPTKPTSSRAGTSYPRASTKFSGSKSNSDSDNFATNMLLMSAADDSGNSRSSASHDTGSRSCGGWEPSWSGGGGDGGGGGGGGGGCGGGGDGGGGGSGGGD